LRQNRQLPLPRGNIGEQATELEDAISGAPATEVLTFGNRFADA
jgi:hypothetical protein